jgi:hypothetical protein
MKIKELIIAVVVVGFSSTVYSQSSDNMLCVGKYWSEEEAKVMLIHGRKEPIKSEPESSKECN